VVDEDRDAPPSSTPPRLLNNACSNHLSQVSLASTNYSFVYVNGLLTINRAATPTALCRSSNPSQIEISGVETSHLVVGIFPTARPTTEIPTHPSTFVQRAAGGTPSGNVSSEQLPAKICKPPATISSSIPFFARDYIIVTSIHIAFNCS
jgi:hypothetical protein